MIMMIWRLDSYVKGVERGLSDSRTIYLLAHTFRARLNIGLANGLIKVRCYVVCAGRQLT